MFVMPEQLYNEVVSVLQQAGRQDLVAQFIAQKDALPAALTSSQAAALLGVASANTVKNWLEGGYFPGAYKTPGGHWRFPRAEVEAVKARLDSLRDRNRLGDLAPSDLEDDGSPPLL